MKRFLDKKIITAQFGGITTPIFYPQTPEGQISKGVEQMSDVEKSNAFDEAIKTSEQIISTEKSAKNIFLANGYDDTEYNTKASAALTSYSLPKLQYDQLVMNLWPKMQEKNFSFASFLELFEKTADRYRSASGITSFFENFFKVLPDLSKTLGNSDVIIGKALDFLDGGESAEAFQKYLLYHMIKEYALFNKIPENKQADIVKATQELENLRADISEEEQELQNYYHVKAQFLNEHMDWFKQIASAIMDMRKDNFINLIGIMRNGIDENSIQFYLRNLKKGDFNALLRGSTPYLQNQRFPEKAPGGVGSRGGHFSDKIRRKVFSAAGSTTTDINRTTNTPSGSRPSGPLYISKEKTDSQKMSSLYGKFSVLISEFEQTIKALASEADTEINLILTKHSTSLQVGPFAAGNVFQYLQNEKESLDESERVIGLIENLIQRALSLKNDLKKEVEGTDVEDPNEEQDKEFVKIALDEKFNLFVKDMRSKQLGLKFNKVLISRQNEYSEAQDLYEDIKVEMESNVSARPVLAPKAILAGFKMADILEEIAEEFKNIGSNNPIRAEQAMKTARRWENLAKQQRAHVFTEIYPGMAQSIGIEATKPTISPSFSLRGAFVDLVNNVRVAGKFMDKEVESDKRFRDYWNNLFMQSKDPRPMGDIIEEKPKHGNLTTEEDAKLHKKTMRKFKKPAAKSRFKKN
jgi:hypothetical protein